VSQHSKGLMPLLALTSKVDDTIRTVSSILFNCLTTGTRFNAAVRLFPTSRLAKMMETATVGDEVEIGGFEWSSQSAPAMPGDHNAVLAVAPLSELERLRRKIETVYIEIPARKKHGILS
jgi:hypothetical protein